MNTSNIIDDIEQYLYFNNQFSEIIDNRNVNSSLSNLIAAYQFNDYYNNVFSRNNPFYNTDFYNYENPPDENNSTNEQFEISSNNIYDTVFNEPEDSEINYEVTSIFNSNLEPICIICSNYIDTSYSMHLLQYHRDILVMSSMFLQETDVEDYYNALINFTTNTLIDNMSYEELNELCNNIGNHIPVNNITEIYKTYVNKNKNELQFENTQCCVICLEDFKNIDIEEVIETIQCKHLFCKTCFITWMKDNKRCPICNTYLIE